MSFVYIHHQPLRTRIAIPFQGDMLHGPSAKDLQGNSPKHFLFSPLSNVRLTETDPWSLLTRRAYTHVRSQNKPRGVPRQQDIHFMKDNSQPLAGTSPLQAPPTPKLVHSLMFLTPPFYRTYVFLETYFLVLAVVYFCQRIITLNIIFWDSDFSLKDRLPNSFAWCG